MLVTQGFGSENITTQGFGSTFFIEMAEAALYGAIFLNSEGTKIQISDVVLTSIIDIGATATSVTGGGPIIPSGQTRLRSLLKNRAAGRISCYDDRYDIRKRRECEEQELLEEKANEFVTSGFNSFVSSAIVFAPPVPLKNVFITASNVSFQNIPVDKNIFVSSENILLKSLKSNNNRENTVTSSIISGYVRLKYLGSNIQAENIILQPTLKITSSNSILKLTETMNVAAERITLSSLKNDDVFLSSSIIKLFPIKRS